MTINLTLHLVEKKIVWHCWVVRRRGGRDPWPSAENSLLHLNDGSSAVAAIDFVSAGAAALDWAALRLEMVT